MAGSGKRRDGNSRRAQYTTFFAYLLAVVGLIIGAVLLLGSRRDAAGFAGARAVAGDVAAPPAQAAAAVRTRSQSAYGVVAGYLTSGARVAGLEREVAKARVDAVEARALGDENRRLKALLGLRNDDPRPVATARLIGSTAASTRRFAMLGAGSDQGVAVGMAVRSPLGLVGRVLEVGRGAARVLLITDSESVVPVRRASDGIPAFATGRSDGTVQLRLISLGINPLRRGDAVVTSGSGGLYRPGIAVAVVTDLTRDGAIARPLSDPGTTEFVVVDPQWEAAAIASDLPPAPGSQPPVQAKVAPHRPKSGPHAKPAHR